jgi:hemerythrin
MAHWQWDEVYSVDIAVIDKQHQQIVTYINELNRLSTYGTDKQSLQEIFFKLLDYTQSHFSFEERLMEEAGYASLEAHKEVHKAFTQRIDFFKERFENGENISKQLMTELQMWLINHIKDNDGDYKEAVQNMLEEKKIRPKQDDYTKSTWLKSLVNKFFK